MKDDLIKFAPLFAGLDDEEQAMLAANFAEETASSGTALFKAGERSEYLYLLGSGFVRLITATGNSLATMGPGSVLGEDTLFRSASHDVTADIVSDLEYWKLSDRQLRDLILRQPSIGIKLSRSFGSLLAQLEDYLVQLLSGTKELGNLPEHTLQAVAQHLQPRELSTGEQLFGSGEAVQGLYVVEQGSIEVQPNSDAVDTQSRSLGSGSILGTAALLTNKAYSSSATAQSDSVVWILTAENFAALSRQYPGLRRSLGRTVRTHLSRGDQAQAALRLSQMPIFSDLPAPTLQAIAQRIVLRHASAGDRIYRVGEVGDALHIVEEGEIELTAENANGVVEELARIGPGAFCGEMSLLTGQIRSEDATATRHTNLWVLYRSDLDTLITQYPAIGTALSQGLATRLATQNQVDDLTRFRSFALLADLSDDDLAQFVQHLEPNRFQAGEQIYRASAPAEELFLLESGEVRVQPFSGGSWLLGPGESFGERALLTNQPHNATVVAESDSDVWVLSKGDFNQMLTLYPSLAINISRLVSQRMGQESIAGTAPTVPMQPVTADSPSRRGRQSQEPRRERMGFGQWFGNLSAAGKIIFSVLILLIIWLLFVAAPSAVQELTRLSGGGAAPSYSNALEAVNKLGSYDVAAMDQDLAQAVAMADQQVMATATYTPYPTSTPLPTATPTVTPTPTSTPRPTATTAPVFIPAAPAPTKEPEPEIVAASAPARGWDSRLDRLGVSVEDAPVGPGQPYWRLVDAVWENEVEAGGKHHIYVEVLDTDGTRVVGHPVTVFWGDGNHTSRTEDKNPPDYAFNYQMYAAGYAYNVKVEGLPSEVFKGAGMGSLADRFRGIHVNYKLVYQKAIR